MQGGAALGLVTENSLADHSFKFADHLFFDSSLTLTTHFEPKAFAVPDLTDEQRITSKTLTACLAHREHPRKAAPAKRQKRAVADVLQLDGVVL